MPILANAKKALRVSHRRAERNQPLRSKMKTMLDTVKAGPTNEALSAAFSAVDRAAKKNLIHWKKAARIKSRASRLLAKTASAKSASPAKVTTATKSAKVEKKTKATKSK